MNFTKSLKLYAPKSDGTPTADQVAAINRYTKKQFVADDLYVREFAVAHTGKDRDGDIFTHAALTDFANTLPGKGLFVEHPTSWRTQGATVGKWFDAQVQTMTVAEAKQLLEFDIDVMAGESTAHVLMASVFLLRTDDSADVINKVDAGIYEFVSIGFDATRDGHVKTSKGEDAATLTAPAEALEASIVWLGAQQGARAIKAATLRQAQGERSLLSAHPEQGIEPVEMPVSKEGQGKATPNPNQPSPKEGNSMKELEQAQARIKALETEAAEAKAAGDQLTQLKSALGDHAELLSNPPALKAAIADGVEAKNAIIDDIVRDARNQGIVGDSDEAVTEAKAGYQAMPTTALKQLHKHASVNLAKAAGGKLPASTPNTDKSQPQTDDQSKGFVSIINTGA